MIAAVVKLDPEIEKLFGPALLLTQVVAKAVIVVAVHEGLTGIALVVNDTGVPSIDPFPVIA